MDSLKIYGLNLDIAWRDRDRNFLNIEKHLQAVQADLLVLPEMFSSGFSMEPEEIADREEETLNWMKKWAKQKDMALCGSVVVLENGTYRNRMYFVPPNGASCFYDKKHLFSFSGENKLYTAGDSRVVVTLKGVRFLLQICYDLRFPVFSRYQEDYDAILYVANWPEKRIDQWQSLLKARAIENQAFVMGVNRIGHDGNGLDYPQSSYLYFADGSLVSETDLNGIYGEINLKTLHDYRSHYNFLSDRDPYEIR